MDDDDVVLVTGGNGFIARWCIVQLLEQGWRVRTTLRDLGRSGDVRAAVGGGDRLEIVAADLLQDDGWDAAVAGCRYVLHPASPMGGGSPDQLVAAARGGALRVLAAAAGAGSGVERVVLTSAANTSAPTSYRTPGVTDETLWTDPEAPGLDPYRRSKTLAEQAAWAFPGSASLLTTILPGAVFGPILGTDNLGSVEVIGRLLRGEQKQLARIGLEVVDVRDVADAHIRAMTCPEAAGERFLATGELLGLPEMAALLRSTLGDAAAKVPTRVVPDVAVRLLARRRPELQGVVPGLGRRNVHSTAKAQRVLGWTPRPAAEAVLDCARSLIEHGVA